MKTLQSNRLSKQRGASFYGILMMLIMITLLFTVGFKVAPIYLDHNMVTGFCQELIDNGQADNMTLQEIRNSVANNLRINQVQGFDLNNIRLRKENGAAVIMIAYETRVEMVANLDVIAAFDETLQ
ncbi:MAG: DUF4845 domain-containing protein [Pseudomonadales bacterium]|nr:DUF4845 domain-containing protein [Pseudomonadales bacterium]